MCFALVNPSEEQWDSRAPKGEDIQVEEQDGDKEMQHIRLVALAPDASIPKQKPSVCTVSATPVFQCLDEVRLIQLVIYCIFH